MVTFDVQGVKRVAVGPAHLARRYPGQNLQAHVVDFAGPEFSERTGKDDLRAGRVPIGQSVGVSKRSAVGRSGLAVLVLAADGSFSAPLSNFPDRGTCWPSGVAERAGTYTLVVRSGTRTTTLGRVKVTADACHVRTRDVSITLDT